VLTILQYCYQKYYKYILEKKLSRFESNDESGNELKTGVRLKKNSCRKEKKSVPQMKFHLESKFGICMNNSRLSNMVTKAA